MGHIMELMNHNKYLTVLGRQMCKYKAYWYIQIVVNMP